MKEQPELTVVLEPIDRLVPYANNANIHTGKQVDQIAASIKEFGFCDPVGVWQNGEEAPETIEGHGRIIAAKKLGFTKVPVIYLNALTDEQRRAYTHVHNQLTRNSAFDVEVLEGEIEQLPFDWEALGFGEFIMEEELGESGEDRKSTLAERFGVAPFSVFNARSGEWQARKRAWIGLGIKSELGRGGVYHMQSEGMITRGNASPSGSPLPLNRKLRGGVTLGAIPPNQRQLYEIMKTRKRNTGKPAIVKQEKTWG